MNSIDENIFGLLTAYLEGECDEAEKTKVMEWINTNEENKKYFFELKLARNFSAFQNYPDKSISWDSTKNKITNKKNFNYRLLLKIAAVFIIAIGLGTTAAIYTGNSIKRNSASLLNETVVPYGSKVELTLSDGSVVQLNSGSKFSYPSVFSKSERTVYLEGEAFFKVKTNKEKPFVVNTNDATIKAYGTEFNVNAYNDEPIVTATLVEGIISVTAKSSNNQEVILKPKEHAIIQKELGNVSVNTKLDEVQNLEKTESEKIEEEITIPKAPIKSPLKVQSKIDTDIYTSWKEDSWIIENESLFSLSKKLERRYDIEITFAEESLKNLRFTGKIVNEPLEQVLLYINLTASLNHNIDGREVQLFLDTTKVDYKTLYRN